MTNSTSLSTHRSWRSRHTTSQQYVARVCIPHLFRANTPRIFNPNPLVTVCSLSLVPRNQLLSVAAACKVLIEFSLMRLENPDEACAVSQVRDATCTRPIESEGQEARGDVTNGPFVVRQKHLILLIKGLCTGCSRLDRTEIITFTAMMKSAKLPQTVKTLSDGECPLKSSCINAACEGRQKPGARVAHLCLVELNSGGSEGAAQRREPRAATERSADEFL